MYGSVLQNRDTEGLTFDEEDQIQVALEEASLLVDKQNENLEDERIAIATSSRTGMHYLCYLSFALLYFSLLYVAYPSLSSETKAYLSMRSDKQ
jgi:hypothetical protein